MLPRITLSSIARILSCQWGNLTSFSNTHKNKLLALVIRSCENEVNQLVDTFIALECIRVFGAGHRFSEEVAEDTGMAMEGYEILDGQGAVLSSSLDYIAVLSFQRDFLYQGLVPSWGAAMGKCCSDGK